MTRRLVLRLAALAALLLLASPALAVGYDRSTLESDPDYRDAKRFIAEQRYREAITKLEFLRGAYPDSPDISNWIAYSHRKLKDYPTSKRFYDEALSIDPAFLPALEYQGEWFIETGDIASAKANLAKLRALCGDCHEYRDLAEALAKAGH